MIRRNIFSTLRWVSVGFIFAAVVLFVFQLVTYSRIRSTFPPRMVIAGIPVGSMNQKDAAERLLQAYSIPVEIRYQNSVIQIKPNVVGFQLDNESMIAAADMERIQQPFWSGFWDYLWGRLPTPKEVPLISSLSEERLRAYLADEISIRYDQPAAAALPVAGSVNFQAGKTGTVLDVDRAVVLISDALRSPNSRVVNLSFSQVSAPKPSFQNLEILLKQIIEVSKYNGIIELYMEDLQTGQTIHFAFNQGQMVPTDVAFTAASTMKIPVMVSVFKRLNQAPTPAVSELITAMIDRSDNDTTDKLMQTIVERQLGPLEVTKDLQALGYQNTFLAGYFYPGAPLLSKIQTPSNQRKDVTTDPDVYNQTTPAEVGMLLKDVYQCADTGGGAFAAVFPGQITQEECKSMIQYLIKNKIAVLLQAGIPEGTQIGHKHGWVIEPDGLMHTVSDAGIIYSPGGNYILTVYMYDRVQLLWDSANLMVSQLSSAVYNYYNLPKSQ